MRRALVIGDVIADVYRHCTLKKRCPEDPRALALLPHWAETRAGGAANVALNLAAMAPDAIVDLIGVVDRDLVRTIKRDGGGRVGVSHCVSDSPLRKERVLLDGKLVVRLDNASHVTHTASSWVTDNLKEYLANHEPDIILFSDYAGGSVDEVALRFLLERRERLVVDTKMTDLRVFGEGGKTLACKLNKGEWEAVIARDARPEEHFATLIVTEGPAGAKGFFHRHAPGAHICSTMAVPGHVIEAVDTNGCGDTFLAGFAAAMLYDRDQFGAMRIGNAAAACAVSKRGTAIIGHEEALALLGNGNETKSRSDVGAGGCVPPGDL